MSSTQGADPRGPHWLYANDATPAGVATDRTGATYTPVTTDSVTSDYGSSPAQPDDYVPSCSPSIAPATLPGQPPVPDGPPPNPPLARSGRASLRTYAAGDPDPTGFNISALVGHAMALNSEASAQDEHRHRVAEAADIAKSVRATRLHTTVLQTSQANQWILQRAGILQGSPLPEIHRQLNDTGVTPDDLSKLTPAQLLTVLHRTAADSQPSQPFAGDVVHAASRETCARASMAAAAPLPAFPLSRRDVQG